LFEGAKIVKIRNIKRFCLNIFYKNYGYKRLPGQDLKMLISFGNILLYSDTRMIQGEQEIKERGFLNEMIYPDRDT
jgi:hypothetical protein